MNRSIPVSIQIPKQAYRKSGVLPWISTKRTQGFPALCSAAPTTWRGTSPFPALLYLWTPAWAGTCPPPWPGVSRRAGALRARWSRRLTGAGSPPHRAWPRGQPAAKCPRRSTCGHYTQTCRRRTGSRSRRRSARRSLVGERRSAHLGTAAPFLPEQGPSAKGSQDLSKAGTGEVGRGPPIPVHCCPMNTVHGSPLRPCPPCFAPLLDKWLPSPYVARPRHPSPSLPDAFGSQRKDSTLGPPVQAGPSAAPAPGARAT